MRVSLPEAMIMEAFTEMVSFMSSLRQMNKPSKSGCQALLLGDRNGSKVLFLTRLATTVALATIVSLGELSIPTRSGTRPKSVVVLRFGGTMETCSSLILKQRQFGSVSGTFRVGEARDVG